VYQPETGAVERHARQILAKGHLFAGLQIVSLHNLPHGVCNAILLPIIENFNRPNAVARFARVAQARQADGPGRVPARDRRC
jgi:alcohol dehydrogenase class IV